MNFRLFKQIDKGDCGNACLRTVFNYYGMQYTSREIEDILNRGKRGTSLQNLYNVTTKLGFDAFLIKISVEELLESFNEPLIIHIDKKHFVVLFKINKKKVYVADPGFGKYSIDINEFGKRFINPYLSEDKGTGLLILPREQQEKKIINDKIKLSYYLSFYLKNKLEIRIILFCLLVASLIGFLFPILAKSMVDLGITGRNLDLINAILIAQLLLTLGLKATEFYRQWIMLYLNTNINIDLLNDFLKRLLKQPLRYFETKTTGDLLQRIIDHKRIDNFISDILFNSIFLLARIIIYSGVLFFFSPKILMIFMLSNIINSVWTLLFLKRKRKLDYDNFEIQSKDKNYIIDFFDNLRDIKLYNIEATKLQSWENLQVQIYQLSKENLKVNQIQQIGSSLLKQSTDFIIIYTSAILFLEGQITFGIMLSIQFMIGQLYGPISFFTNFIDGIQKVKLSLERLNEIKIENVDEQNLLIEEEISKVKLEKISSIRFKDISFKYGGSETGNFIFNNFNAIFERGKLNVISGESGRGKSTLVKILLKIYNDYHGDIFINDLELKSIPENFWKERCKGTLQGLSLFEDTIVNNIVLSEANPDFSKLNSIVENFNLKKFIDDLPNKWTTKVGGKYLNPSEGQKQRILLSRLIYSNPDVLILDEATNSLDKENERNILKYLNSIKQEKIVIIITHNEYINSIADNKIIL